MTSVAHRYGFFPLALVAVHVAAPVKAATARLDPFYRVRGETSAAAQIVAGVRLISAGRVIAYSTGRARHVEATVRSAIVWGMVIVEQVFDIDVPFETATRNDVIAHANFISEISN